MDLTAGSATLMAVLLGYLLGSIPFGLILTRAAGVGDIRRIGSGNIGATNVLRTGHKGLAAATLLLDAAKGALAVWSAAPLLGPVPDPGLPLGYAAGLGAFLGHVFPVWLNFRGGKGVATYIGAVWLATAAISRYSSLSALLASAVTPIVLAASGQTAAAWLFAVLSLLLIYKHRQNIARLLAGQEPKLGAKS